MSITRKMLKGMGLSEEQQVTELESQLKAAKQPCWSKSRRKPAPRSR